MVKQKKLLFLEQLKQKLIDEDSGAILSTSIVPYGSTIFIKKGKVKVGDKVCEWDPYNAVIVSEIDGKIKFNDIIEVFHLELNLMSKQVIRKR